MTGAVTVCRNDAYRDRAKRAAHLAGERPHAAAILELYGEVLALQETLFERALAPEGSLAAALPRLTTGEGPASAGQFRRLPIERLPYAELDDLFVSFVGELSASATDPLAEAGAALLGAPASLRAELLCRIGGQDELGPIAAVLGLSEGDAVHPGLVFFPRAFLQPVAEALADSTTGVDREATGDPAAEPEGVCPRCGWPPQAAVLRDAGDTQGRRTLVCALCATEWPFPRVRCPSCGETDASRLVLHEAESVPGLRVAECQACQAYLKEVDLRRDGHAVPLVEDLATPELDVWAEERGLWKICRNLVGL